MKIGPTGNSNEEVIEMSLRVENPTTLTKKCRRSIAEVTGIKNLGFKRYGQEYGRRETWRLVGERASYGLTDRQRHIIIPFIETNRTVYWLSSSLDLVFDSGEYVVEAISLSVFRGGIRVETKEVIFRAEWASHEDNGGEGHAQPHWHIYPEYSGGAQREIDTPFTSTEGPVAEFSAEREMTERDPKWTGAHKFHYAMASRWHEGNADAHKIDLEEEDEALNWIKGCISYVKYQIMYVDK